MNGDVDHVEWLREPAEEPEEGPPARSGVVALILVNLRGDTRHRGYEVLRRGLREEVARAICSDERTRGEKHSVMWTDEANLGDDWRWRDDGRYDGVLAEYGVGVRPSP